MGGTGTNRAMMARQAGSSHGRLDLVSNHEVEATDPVPPDVRARLAAVAYLILPPALGHARRAALAHRNVAQALGPGLTDEQDRPLTADELTRLRVRVLRLALLGAGNRSRVPVSRASRTGEAGAR